MRLCLSRSWARGGGPRTRRFSARRSWEATDRQLGRAAVAVGVLASVLALWAVHAAMPPNAVQLPLESSRTMQTLLPEGWAFFTADPTAVYPQAYELSPAGRWTYTGGSLAVSGDAFGLDRSRRAQGTEMALLLQGVSAGDWHNCTGGPTTCLSAWPVTAHVVNTSTLQNLCGDVGFVEQQMLPWAWRGTGTVMPSQVVRVEVRCDKDQ
jgi:antimicrobial peptide system SdpA family protein